MAEGRSHESLGRKYPRAIAPPAHADGPALEIVEGGGDRLVMAAAHRGLDVGGANAEQQAHALRRGERQIDGGVAVRPAPSAKKLAMSWVLASEGPPQAFIGDGARQANAQGSLADPSTRRPVRFAVVVLGTAKALCAASTRPCAVPA